MRLQIFGGMASDKLICQLVPWHPVDPVTKHVLASCGEFAIPGGGVATEKEVRKWAEGLGYKVKRFYIKGEERETHADIGSGQSSESKN